MPTSPKNQWQQFILLGTSSTRHSDLCNFTDLDFEVSSLPGKFIGKYLKMVLKMSPWIASILGQGTILTSMLGQFPIHDRMRGNGFQLKEGRLGHV